MMAESIDELLFHASVGKIKQVLHYLSEPTRLSWPGEPDILDQQFREIDTCLASHPSLSHLSHLLRMSVLCDVMCGSNKQNEPIIDWVKTNLDVSTLLSGIAPDRAFSLDWQPVPLVSVGHGGNTITCLMLGAGKPEQKSSGYVSLIWPEWFVTCLDEDAKQGIVDALNIAELTSGKTARWYLFGLVSSRSAPVISGRSLAFPIALAARSLLENKPCYKGYIATGDLSLNNGKPLVEPVQDIDLKWNQAKEKGFTLFLYPQGNALKHRLPDDIKSIPVELFEHGWMWATLYSRNRAGALKSLENALHSPESFVANCETLDTDCFQWCSESELVRGYLQTISADVNKIIDLGRKLDTCYDRSQGDYSRVSVMAAFFDTPESIEKFGDVSPVTALLWCSVHLALANHAGDSKRSRHWCEQGMKYYAEAFSQAEGKKIINRFINRGSGITDRHNRYDFRPSMPEEFMTVFNQQLQINALNGCTVDYCIGSIYGTIAQNFAFCGPAYIEETQKNITLSQAAFGDGKVPERRGDWLRQFSYLYFALLDCDEAFHSQAVEALYNYLEMKNTQTGTFDEVFAAWNQGDPFPLFALVRGLADIPWIVSPFEHERLSEKIFHLTDELKLDFFETNPDKIHPRQLITYNTGRIALLGNDSDRAYDEFKKSITLCRYGADTINAMTLLPLSRIHEMGRMDSELAQIGLKVLKKIQTSNYLNKSHFNALTGPIEIEKALDLVAAQPQIFFPFNYR
jgi:hypothetical protein